MLGAVKKGVIGGQKDLEEQTVADAKRERDSREKCS